MPTLCLPTEIDDPTSARAAARFYSTSGGLAPSASSPQTWYLVSDLTLLTNAFGGSSAEQGFIPARRHAARRIDSSHANMWRS